MTGVLGTTGAVGLVVPAVAEVTVVSVAVWFWVSAPEVVSGVETAVVSASVDLVSEVEEDMICGVMTS